MKNYFGENEVILVHGTSANPMTILRNGFKNVDGAWNCSEYNRVYFYEYTRWCECEGYDTDEEYAINTFVHRANEQGQITNAFKDNPLNETYVLEFHLPEDFKKEIEDDDSCPNMENYGSIQIYMDTINKYMLEGKCKVIVHTFIFSSKCSLLYISNLVNNEYAQEAIDNLPLVEKEALKIISKTYFEEFFEAYVSDPDEIEIYEFDFTTGHKVIE